AQPGGHAPGDRGRDDEGQADHPPDGGHQLRRLQRRGQQADHAEAEQHRLDHRPDQGGDGETGAHGALLSADPKITARRAGAFRDTPFPPRGGRGPRAPERRPPRRSFAREKRAWSAPNGSPLPRASGGPLARPAARDPLSREGRGGLPPHPMQDISPIPGPQDSRPKSSPQGGGGPPAGGRGWRGPRSPPPQGDMAAGAGGG